MGVRMKRTPLGLLLQRFQHVRLSKVVDTSREIGESQGRFRHSRDGTVACLALFPEKGLKPRVLF